MQQWWKQETISQTEGGGRGEEVKGIGQGYLEEDKDNMRKEIGFVLFSLLQVTSNSIFTFRLGFLFLYLSFQLLSEDKKIKGNRFI